MHTTTEDEHETILETASEDDDQDASCVVINGDEEWLRDYERMSDGITWSREEYGSEPYDKCPMKEEETPYPTIWTGEEFGNVPDDTYPMEEEETPCPTIDQVVVTLDGDMIHWHCQVVVTAADQTKDQGQRLDHYQHGPADKIGGDTSTSERDGDTEHIGEPVTLPSNANNKRADDTKGTVNLDLRADKTGGNNSFSERDENRGHVDESVTMLGTGNRKRSDTPTGIVHPALEAACETAMPRKVKDSSNLQIEEQMPAVTTASRRATVTTPRSAHHRQAAATW